MIRPGQEWGPGQIMDDGAGGAEVVVQRLGGVPGAEAAAVEYLAAHGREHRAHALEQRGIAAESLARLTCPIGVTGITGKQPELIAVAVVAQEARSSILVNQKLRFLMKTQRFAPLLKM